MMKRKSGLDPGGALGDAICAIVGAGSEGVGYGACEAVKGAIPKILGGFGGEQAQSKPDIIKERYYQYQRLSNLLKTMGSTDPSYTDPKKLQLFFEGPDGGNTLAYNGADGALKIAKGLENFIANGVLVRNRYPNFVNKSIDWVFKYYKRSGYDINGTLQQLQKLQDESVNPAMVNYVINIINDNYFGAIMFKLMMSVGEKDLSKITKEYGETMQTAVRILGEQSADVLNFQDAVNETAKATFDELALSEQSYKIHLNMARERAFVRRQLVERGGPLMLSLLDSPFAHVMNRLAPVFGAFGPEGVAGQAASQMRNRT
jgi:hypothetical protein